MRFAFLAFFEPAPGAPSVSAADRASVRQVVSTLPGLSRALIFTPDTASDLYNDDGDGPCFGFQLYFEAIEALETAAGATGGLQAIAAPGGLPSLAGARVRHQAMLVRRFAVPDPRPDARQACSYVVHYPGPAADDNAWHAHYLAHHPPIMARFPGIRELEILTRLDWVDALPWRRVRHLQRNRVTFDDAAALTAALHSPVRHEMRADFATFPAYEGGNFHYPMATEIVRP